MGFEPMCDLTRKLISSQPRYDHFDTSPCVYFNPATSGRRKEIGEKSRRENKKILSCECSENPVKSMVFKDERSEVPTRFRVSPVMSCCGERKERAAERRPLDFTEAFRRDPLHTGFPLRGGQAGKNPA